MDRKQRRPLGGGVWAGLREGCVREAWRETQTWRKRNDPR